MNTKIMEYILVVAEEKSFSRAAKRLFLSQPSLSQSIITVEKQLGTTLFDRSTVPLSLTYAGEKYIEYAEKMLNLQHELEMQMADVTGNRMGQLNIGISLFRNSTILTHVFPVFHRLYPNVKLVVKEAINEAVIEMALSGETDLSFINNTTPTGLICIDLLTDLVLLAVGKEHPLCKDYEFGKGYPKINLRLFKDDFFALTSRNSNLRRISNEIFSDYNFIPKISIETYSLELTHQLAAQNTAVALILDSLLKLYPDKNRVCYFLFDRNEYHNELYICYKKNRDLTNIMSDFIRITKEVVKQQEYRFHYGPNLPNAPGLLSPWW